MRTREHDGAEPGDRGTATAEFAVVLPALVLLIVVLVGAAGIGFAQLRAFDAARSAAREIAQANRGPPSSMRRRSMRARPRQCAWAPTAATRK